MPYSKTKILIVVSIQVTVALAHAFRLGQVFSGKAYILYYSYFSDFILPFAWYFLLTINDAAIPVLRPWYAKAGTVFILCTAAEVCQRFGIEVLGVTFDPVDIIMYGMGALLAAFVDVKLFSPYVNTWATKYPV